MKLFSGARILAIAKKEFFHLRRDHLTGGMVVGLPIMMTLLFGYAINQDVRNLNAGVVDEAVHFGAQVQGPNRVFAQRAITHGGDVEDAGGVRLRAVRAADGDAQFLRVQV